MKISLTMVAATTTKFNTLHAIKQILMGFENSVLVKENFPNGFDNDISENALNANFKRLNEEKKKWQNKNLKKYFAQ